MAVTPDTDLYLLKSILEIDNQNQLTFSNATAQAEYFLSLPKIAVENYSYQRKDGVIRMEGHIDQLQEFNYVMYKNNNYSNKWFYAYVDDMQYMNDNSTAVSIKTDVFQTWQFQLQWKETFVDREHVNNDAFGLHTLPEGMESGEYVSSGTASYNIASTGNNAWIVVQVSDLPDEVFNVIGSTSRVYSGLPNGCWFLAFPNNSEAYGNINNMVKWFSGIGKEDAIVSMFVAPKDIFNSDPVILSFESSDGIYSFDAYRVPASSSAKSLQDMTFTRNTSLNGYTPKNNKTLCYPYNYLMISNSGGSSFKYHWEDFSSSTATFAVKGILNQGCDIKAIPKNYKNTNESSGYEWSISAQKLPTISWQSDFYLNWQAQNGLNAVYNSGSNMVNSGANMVQQANNPWDQFVQGAIEFGENVFGFIGQVDKTIHASTDQYSAVITPDQSKGNANTGDINYSLDKIGFIGFKMSVKAEVAKMVDHYFTMFGYKINEMKIPNITGRRNWNYVKTVGANIEAYIPQDDLQEIKSMFDRGITLWHNPRTFLDYSQDNSIV